MVTSVLLVEDDTNTLQRLVRVVNSIPDVRVVGTAADLVAARLRLKDRKPDLLLTDLQLPDGNGIDLIRQARSGKLSIECMVISVFGDERNVLAALMAGASGYLLKDGTTDDFTTAIKQLLAGGSPISPAIARHVLKRLTATQDPLEFVTPPPMEDHDTQLTDREVDILQAVGMGFTYAEIASDKRISYHTVSTHVKNVYRKLEVHSRTEAVMEAVKLGLIRVEARGD